MFHKVHLVPVVFLSTDDEITLSKFFTDTLYAEKNNPIVENLLYHVNCLTPKIKKIEHNG